MKYYLDEAVSLQLDSALTSALILTTFSLKLPSTTNNPLGWALPPLVICAVEAHPEAPHIVHWLMQARNSAATLGLRNATSI